MSIDKNLYAGINATYISSLLLSAGFSNTDLPPNPLVLVQKLEDYLQSYDWTVDWYDSIDPTKLNDKLLSLYDELSDVRNIKLDDVSPVDDMMTTLSLQLGITEAVESVRDDVKLPEPVEAVVVPVSSDDNLQLFANHYSLIVWSSITKHHNFDVLDSEDEYANKYEETILHEYYQDDKPYRAKDFHEFCISCSEANNIINKYIDINKLWQMGHTDEYVIEIASYFFENYDIPSEKEAYHKYAPHLIPVRDDVKLPEPVEVIELPQEVVSEPQEGLSTTTQINGDDVMNNNTVWLDWSISTPCLKAWELDFGTYVVVEPEPIVELTGQASDFACHISDGWTGQCTELTCDVLSGQCCDLDDAPKPVEQLSDAQYRVARACAKMARRSAYASPVRCGSPVVNTPTITTKSGDIVKVSDEEFAELESMFDKAMAKPKFPFTVVNNNSLQGNQINPDCSRAKAIIGYGQVSEFKSTLFNVDEYDITRNVVVDVATTTPATPKATVAPKAPATPKPSTAKFANNFNSLVIAKYRELNNGIIKDSLVLNKLTSALRANNSEAYTALVTTFGNPTAVALHRQAYDAVVSAS